MDADDYCTNDMIEKQMERMLKDGDENTLIFSPVKMLYPDGKFFLPPREIDKDYIPGIELLIDIWRERGWNCPHCHLMHRNLFVKSKGWDESILRNQDGEFLPEWQPKHLNHCRLKMSLQYGGKQGME